jgi:hypothetical protein
VKAVRVFRTAGEMAVSGSARKSKTECEILSTTNAVSVCPNDDIAFRICLTSHVSVTEGER